MFISFFDIAIQAGTIIIYIVHMRKENLGRVKNLTKNFSANK